MLCLSVHINITGIIRDHLMNTAPIIQNTGIPLTVIFMCRPPAALYAHPVADILHIRPELFLADCQERVHPQKAP